MEVPSCNSFVVLPPLTSNGSVIFGKNSDRPQGEVQELIYEPPKQYSAGETLKCTYIEIDQDEKTYGVVLSKPAWMWGCEMGANDQGVVVANGAVQTKVKCNNIKKKALLGTDLVRLALERCSSAEEGVDVITKLLTQYGQGGCYSESVDDLTYHNSFLLVDAKEAWILETVENHWVAQKVTGGYRYISRYLTIEDCFDKKSPDVINFAKENGFWNGEGNFSFAAAFSENNDGKIYEKYLKGSEMIKRHTENNNFGIKNMFEILRDSSICNNDRDSFKTAASQVSLLSRKSPCCHWFTATPDPVLSVFKPFIFTPNVRISLHTKSPVPDDLATVEKPFDRSHNLYKLHANTCASSNNKVIALLQEMEQNCLKEVEKFLEDFQEEQSLGEVDELLKDVVETEVKFYK